LGGQRIDLTQQQPRQLGVVVIEATVERSDESPKEPTDADTPTLRRACRT